MKLVASESRNADQEEPETITSFLACARDLRAIIAQESGVTESGRTLSPAVVEAMQESGLFWVGVPREIGGGGGGLVDAMEVIEEVTYSDGATGWSLMANQSTTTAASVYLGDTAIDAMFGQGTMPVLAGMLGPAGKSRPTTGGYQAGGKFSFGSGSGHADWIGSGMLVIEDGRPRMLPSGLPEVRVCFIKRDNIEMLDNWYVTGLVGTGSFDYAVPEQFVPEDFTFERTTTQPLRGGPRFSLGLPALAASGHAAVAMGLMKRALEEIVAIASAKKRPGYSGFIGDHDLFRQQFTLNEAVYQAARDYTFRVFREAETLAAAGEFVSPVQRARLRQATTWVHQAADAIVHFCHLWAGSEVFQRNTPISRVSRDMAVATQHIYVDPITLIDAAPAIMTTWQR